MGSRGRRAAVAAAVLAGGSLLPTSTAGAAEESQTLVRERYSFTDSYGDRVTCTIEIGVTHLPDTQQAGAETRIVPGGDPRCTGTVGATLLFVDTQGNRQRSRGIGRNGATEIGAWYVGGSVSSEHDIQFDNADTDHGCCPEWALQPK